MARRKFAFIIHPRVEVRHDMGLFWPPLRRVPEPIFDWALRTLPLSPITCGEVFLGQETEEPDGWLILVPLGAQQMRRLPRGQVVARVEAAVNRAVSLGAEIVGLGELAAPATQGGQKLAYRRDVGITNGNALTAAMMAEAIRNLLVGQRGQPEVAVVGASTSAGSCLVRLLARQGQLGNLTLVGRDLGRLQALAAAASGAAPWLRVRVGTEMSHLLAADLVVLLSSSIDYLLRPEHLKLGAMVLDGTQPRNTSPRLPVLRPDVRVVDGGLVMVPGMRVSKSIDLPAGCAFPCLAEPLLLALAGHSGHFSIGTPSVEQAEYMAQLAKTYGVSLTPFHSFGRPLLPGGFPPFFQGCQQ